MLKTGMAQLILISAITGAMSSTHQRSIQVPTGRDAISADEQAEKLSKAEQKRARKAAKRKRNMNKETHKTLVELERDIRAMHQPHLGCPSHESAFDEEDFLRIFGAGDEQPQRRASIYRELDDSGHSRRDFE